MSAAGPKLGGQGRRLAHAVEAGVGAALAQDAAALDRAAATLAGDPERSGVVVASVVRTLLELQHAGGLDGDDVAAALRDCVERATPWFPADPAALVVVLTGALGAPAPADGEASPPSSASVSAHGVLLLAHLLTPVGEASTGGSATGSDREVGAGGADGAGPAGAGPAGAAPVGAGERATRERASVLAALAPLVDASFAEVARHQTLEAP